MKFVNDNDAAANNAVGKDNNKKQNSVFEVALALKLSSVSCCMS